MLYYPAKNWPSRGGGIGRRAGLKIRWWQHREGSSPSLGTIKSRYKVGMSFEAQQYKILFSQTIIILKPSSWQEKYLFRLTMNT